MRLGFALPQVGPAAGPDALKRVAQQADGWFPVLIPLHSLSQMFEGIQHMAQEAGRDPTALELIVRANVEISDAALENNRVDFTGSLEQIADDIVATRRLGAAELLFDVQFSPGVETVDDIITHMEQLWQAARPA